MVPVADLELKPLKADDRTVAELQCVLESRADYHRLVNGEPTREGEAASIFAEVPDDFDRVGKHVFGIYRGASLLGCIDVLVGYPDSLTAMLGLLIVASDAEGRGVGSRALVLLEDWLRNSACCERVRIGVVATNGRVIGFWHRMGYVETGERRQYAHGPVTSEVIVMSKAL